MRWKSLEWHQYHAPLVLFSAGWSEKVFDQKFWRTEEESLSARLTPGPCFQTAGTGRAGRKTSRLGAAPGPAGPVHGLAGERADQNGR